MAAPPITGEAATEGRASACGNCCAAVVGRFCHACGAPQDRRHDLSLRHFAGEMAAEISNLERSKLLRTLWALCFRPGLLTTEHFTARRVRYLKPLTLTLAVFALHLFVFTAIEGASSFSIERLAPGGGTGTIDDSGARIWSAIERHAAARGAHVDDVAQGINNRWIRNFSLFQIPLIAFLALWTGLVLLRKRRHLVEHVVFGMHLISFTGFTVVLLYPLLYLAGSPLAGAGLALLIGKFVFDCAWVSLAARRVYGLGKLGAAAAGIAIMAGYFAAFTAANQVALALALGPVLR